MKDIHYFLFFLVSFLVTVWINYHNNSVKIQKLVLRWEEKCFHIHHWLTFSGILLAFVLGILSLKRIKAEPKRLKGRGMALAGMIIPPLFIIVSIIMWFLSGGPDDMPW